MSQVSSDREYRKLLDSVINAAMGANLPLFAAPRAQSSTNRRMLLEAALGSRSTGQIRHDIKIGAAGELYVGHISILSVSRSNVKLQVFEMLLKENLGDFGWANWKSTIRKHVCVHEDYKDMKPWRGRETADIVYTDRGPKYRLTIVLEALCHLIHRNLPPDGSITYYFEVKTTTQECDTRFFISRAQYNRVSSSW